ncbi:hypothetical protein TUMSATVNIG1_51720 [Vibrio nigripulchritudo]|uniref:YadA C-terminal domain-containing protein n=1 Tax=Vibrio nigripulchritudo TaxID=28173 RepID=UPI00190970C8|nr:YadA C-terminal domain-containing protein [Vibrio nigripulchritudo]BCL73199.1 hypothetical protein VNTUMSATTG_51360 [Vibrio nigripulchritudo]BDU34563.1 hypothetical protein TUMSATVNIG1_51720 [Vibrio nigripulchritudo]
MKKSLIALSLVSVFSGAASAASVEINDIDANKAIEAIKKEAQFSNRSSESHGKFTVRDEDGKAKSFVYSNRSGQLVVEDTKTGQKYISDSEGKVAEVIVTRDDKGNRFETTERVREVKIIDNNSVINGEDANWKPNNDVIDISNGNEDQVFDKAAKASERISKGETVVEIRDGQGKVIETIDAHNVHKYQKEFMELSDSEKIKRLQEIEAAAKNGQIIEGNTPSPRPEPTDPTVDDAMDWVNERINGAGREVAIAAAQYDARLDSLEANFNAMAERQHRQEMRINENEGKMSNGIAGVAAMANIPTVSGKTTFGAGVGHFNGSNAIAIGASTGFENGISLKGSLSYAKGKWDQKDVVVGAGIGYSF